MKKAAILLLFLAALLSALSTALAAEERGLVSDNADILTQEQLAELQERARDISQEYECEIVIVTVKNMYDFDAAYAHDDGDAYVFNKALYNENNFGYGPEKSCLLLCLSTRGRDYWLEPYGPAKTIFTRSRIDTILDSHVLPELKFNHYYQAFSKYLDSAKDYLSRPPINNSGNTTGESSISYSVDPDMTEEKNALKIGITVFVSLLTSLIVCLVWRGKMKTAKIARTADLYITPGGVKITGQSDKFLYRTVVRRRIETDSSSSEGSSSSGSSGRGGKY